MTLFPPYQGVNLPERLSLKVRQVRSEKDLITRFIGYHFICIRPSQETVYEKMHGISPADDKYFNKNKYTSHLDIERLAVQIVAVVLITCGLAFAFQRRKTD